MHMENAVSIQYLFSIGLNGAIILTQGSNNSGKDCNCLFFFSLFYYGVYTIHHSVLKCKHYVKLLFKRSLRQWQGNLLTPIQYSNSL